MACYTCVLQYLTFLPEFRFLKYSKSMSVTTQRPTSHVTIGNATRTSPARRCLDCLHNAVTSSCRRRSATNFIHGFSRICHPLCLRPARHQTVSLHSGTGCTWLVTEPSDQTRVYFKFRLPRSRASNFYFWETQKHES